MPTQPDAQPADQPVSRSPHIPSPNIPSTDVDGNGQQASVQSGQSTSWWVRLRDSQRENVQILAIALALAILIRVFVAEPRYIPSNSMEPTLLVGDRLVIEKVGYRLHPPQTGDIVVFEPPSQFLEQFGFLPDKAFIKRVIGTSGDSIKVQDGAVYLNGQPLPEAYIAEPPAYEMPEVQVPVGKVFVMGDNRNNSNDSHVWGFLPQQNIIGRAILRFFPFDRFGRLN
ncbi:MAG: signal peptidase I [Cyanobacteria bacterium RM1_2_2]|nr:signal peptidase I [Cyanobacteria bacterium RM1_2_2]